jgi:hypothetical protein
VPTDENSQPIRPDSSIGRTPGSDPDSYRSESCSGLPTDRQRAKALVIALLAQSKEELKQADAAITAAIDLRTSAMYKLGLAEELAYMCAETSGTDIADDDNPW